MDEWKSHLVRISSNPSSEIQEMSFLGREMRAGAAIAAMAEVEALLREMLVCVGDHITVSKVKFKKLLPSLRPLAMNSTFDELTDIKRIEKKWDYRLLVTRLEDSHELAVFPTQQTRSPQPPLDGRTIQPHHISVVWKVLGIPNPIPSASIVASLKKLTQIRNDVAHRNVSVDDVFSQAGNSAKEIALYLEDISLLLMNIGVEWDEYIRFEKYLIGDI